VDLSEWTIAGALWVVAIVQVLRLCRELVLWAHDWWVNRWFPVKGQMLDKSAWALYGIKRRVWESDASLRRRCSDKWKEIDREIAKR